MKLIETFDEKEIKEMIETTGLKTGSAIKITNALKEKQSEATDPYADEDNEGSLSYVVNNEAKENSWTPQMTNEEHLDFTDTFRKQDNKCSVRDTCARIRNNTDGVADRLPAFFYVKSSRYQTFFKINIRKVEGN